MQKVSFCVTFSLTLQNTEAPEPSSVLKEVKPALISSLWLQLATAEWQTCWQPNWPADARHRILFLEPHCFYRLTAFKYGPNPFIVPLVWWLLEVEKKKKNQFQASYLKACWLYPVLKRQFHWFVRLVKRKLKVKAISSILLILKGMADLCCLTKAVTLCLD